MPTPDDISSQMAQSLAASEPDLDTGKGTPIRKVLDTVAEGISEAYLDRYLLNYVYDIDSRSGSDLDAFVSQFGFARRSATRASGVVLMQRSVPASSSTVIGSGTQLSTSDSTPVIVQTTSAVIFPQSTLSITVPVQAVIGGSSGNLPASSIVRWVTQIDGVAAVSNPSPLTGGADSESDDALRNRFKKTIFRNLAGTEDMYLGVALDDVDVTSAIVLGPSEKWRERIEIKGGTATSTSFALTERTSPDILITAATNATPIVLTTNRPHSLLIGDVVSISGVVGNLGANGTWLVSATASDTSFAIFKLDNSAGVAGTGAWTSGGKVFKVRRGRQLYDVGYAIGQNLDNGTVLTPTVHYTQSLDLPPVVTVLDSGNMPDGIYDWSFNYVPEMARNDLNKGIANRVDVWAAGSRSATAAETTVADGYSLFSSTPSSPMYVKRFRRTNGTIPTVGSLFLPLGFKPVITPPASISVGPSTTIPASSTYFVRQIGVDHGSVRSVEGIEVPIGLLSMTGNYAIASSTNASPIVVTIPAHSFSVGQKVLIAGHTTNTNANGQWTISAVSGTTVTLSGSIGNGVGGATGNLRLFTPVTLSYAYNEIPRRVQTQIENWRMVTTDVLVHASRVLPIRIYAAVILRPGYSQATVQTPVETAVSSFLAQLGLGAILQISDLLNVIGDVAGIDAVRLTVSSDVTPLTISAASNATPIVITTTTPHNTTNPIIGYVAGVVGNTAANGQWRAQYAGSFLLTLLDSAGNGAYTSGGTFLPATFGVVTMSDDGVSQQHAIHYLDGSTYRTRDIVANDNENFALHSVVLSVKAQNSWLAS